MSRSRLFVIDASIARSAGSDETIHLTAKNCRDFLHAIRTICHRVAFSEAVENEWNRHQSGFARKWRTSMFAKKKVERTGVAENQTFRNAIASLATTEINRDAILKDAHLIEAAMASEEIIASLDETVRGLFRTFAAELSLSRKLIWVNPDRPEEEIPKWLEDGAPPEAKRRLRIDSESI